jgi:hypothetical protein
MDMVFSLVEKLVALAHPTIVGLQSLLGVTLSPVNNANQYWSFYEAHPASGLVASVDLREPVGGRFKVRAAAGRHIERCASALAGPVT